MMEAGLLVGRGVVFIYLVAVQIWEGSYDAPLSLTFLGYDVSSTVLSSGSDFMDSYIHGHHLPPHFALRK